MNNDETTPYEIANLFTKDSYEKRKLAEKIIEYGKQQVKNFSSNLLVNGSISIIAWTKFKMIIGLRRRAKSGEVAQILNTFGYQERKRIYHDHDDQVFKPQVEMISKQNKWNDVVYHVRWETDGWECLIFVRDSG